MNLQQALNIVLDMAVQNLFSDNELYDEKERQSEAIEQVAQLRNEYEQGPYVIQVRWGTAATREEMEDEEPCEYTFNTKAEANAFMEALNEHDGWMECENSGINEPLEKET